MIIITALLKTILYLTILIGGSIACSFGFTWIQLQLSHIDNYLLFISPNVNMYIILFTFFSLFIIINKFILNKPSKNSNNKIVKFITNNPKEAYSLIIAFYIFISAYALTNYCVIYKNSIVKHNIFNPAGKNYTLKDIKDVKVGVKLVHIKKYDLYYTLEFKDNSQINLYQTHDANGKEIHNVLLEIDTTLKENHIKKIINKTNLNKLGKNLDPQYIEKTKMLFDK